jgi:alkylation response protein AidB-like acyl-CoA dehydrogenase
MSVAEAPTETEVADTPEEAAFRARCRAFLEANTTRKGDGPAVDRSEGDDEWVDMARRFHHAQADAGLAGLQYPVEYGGQGLDRRFGEIWTKEASAYSLPTFATTISMGMCVPIMNDFGTPELKERHLARMIRADEIWCQMFSEPGAGSDVASLQTKAVRDGDEWVLNGQKVWTSGAHYCDYGLCVARTDPDLPKHEGISMFMVDLRAPGVEIRPLRQITGEAGFNEVFLTDVRIPAEWLIGDLNRGWNVAVAMLMYERVALGAGGSGPMSARRIDGLIEAARERGVLDDPVVRQDLMNVYIGESILKYVGLRTRAALKAGRAPGPEGSIAKVMSAALAVRTASVAMRIAGAGGVAWLPDDESGDRTARGVLGAPAIGIAGGTNEVQRNIIGERVLGLPKEPSVDKGVPFKDLLVGTQKRD